LVDLIYQKNCSDKIMDKKISIIGGGLSGLVCSHFLLKKGLDVDLYECQNGLAKKFLVAGKGGLNLTHSEPTYKFSRKYFEHEEFFHELISEFSSADLRQWLLELGVETFVGSSGRVFPSGCTAGEILAKISSSLNNYSGFTLFKSHRLVGLNIEKELSFETDNGLKKLRADNIVLCLGGASWSITGSDGKWSKIINSLGVKTNPFRPMNCGFEVAWNDPSSIDGKFLKNICVKYPPHEKKGELLLTSYGLEGGAIYALSYFLEKELRNGVEVGITIDLKPDLSLETTILRLNSAKAKESTNTTLRKKLGLSVAALEILKNATTKEEYFDKITLANRIKSLPISLIGTRPLDEAISTSGGVDFDEVDQNLMLKNIPGVYVVGEMLDWQAPTGGYLFQGCISMSHRVSKTLGDLLT
jgi:uncharacterized flavoprotein (TIGR03862 family)